MKCTIIESVKHELDLDNAYAEKVLKYILDNYVSPSRAVERVDKLKQAWIFPQGHKQATIEWDATNVVFTQQEVEQFCRKYHVENVDEFIKGLEII